MIERKCDKDDSCMRWYMYGILEGSRIETHIVPRIELVLGVQWFLLIVMWICMNVLNFFFVLKCELY